MDVRPPWRTVLQVLFATYLVGLVVVLLGPSPQPGVAGVTLGYEILTRLGVPPGLATPERLEVLLNVALLAPLPAIGCLLWSSLTWRDWTAYGFVLSLAAETWQGVAFAGRSATYSDVVANTAGAFVGALAAELVRRVLRWQRRDSSHAR